MNVPKAKDVNEYLEKAISLKEVGGISNMARTLNVSVQAIRGWQDRNRMPDAEYSCRSKHALKIQAMTKNKVTVKQILGHVPACIADKVDELDKQQTG